MHTKSQLDDFPKSFSPQLDFLLTFSKYIFFIFHTNTNLHSSRHTCSPPSTLPLLIPSAPPLRKNIVPHEYRRHFPAELKDHNSHDILLLCTACHAASNVHDGSLKQLLAEEHGAPQGCEEGVRVLEDSDRRRVRSAARALLTAGDALPQRRRSELQGLIQDFLEPDGRTDGGELTSEDLQYAAELETR